MHHPPQPPDQNLLFAISSLEAEIRAESAYQQHGHAARTLAKSADLRIVLMVMKAGSQVAEHRANHSAMVFLHAGKVDLRLPERSVTLEPGNLLVIAPGVLHDVQATLDSTLLLTLGWKA